MVNATSSHNSMPEPQFFTINNLQDAFDLLSRGFEVYSQASGAGSRPVRVESNSDTPVSPTATSKGTSPPTTGHKRSSYQPDVDIFETSDAVLVELSLPGVSKTDINIEHDSKMNRVLVFGDSKRSHLESEGIKPIRAERSVGHFERVVALGEQVILADQIGAEYKDGVLYITIPKNKEAETKRKIAVS